jgi:hypothetical protein
MAIHALLLLNKILTNALYIFFGSTTDIFAF